MLKYKVFKLFPEYQTNTYLFWDDSKKEAILFDPASPDKSVSDFIDKNKLQLKLIINTHGHLDHIGGNDFYRNIYNIPLLIHRNDEKMLTNPKLNLSEFTPKIITSKPADIVIDNNSPDIFLGNYKLIFIHTPGHTKGSISIHLDNYLVSGDTLFYESIGRTDLPGGNYDEIIHSIKEKLFKLPDNTIVLPGHGEDTTIENEKVGNPFVGILSEF